MKYVYDITLNFQKEYYDFYEWNNSDKIIKIKKVPLYRISKEDYLSIKYNDVIINNKLCNLILVTNGIEVMGILLQNGNVIKKSSLLINDEDKILDSIHNMKITKIYFKKNKYRERLIINRTSLEKKKCVDEFFRKIDKYNDEYLLKYIYYDLYKKEDDIDKIYSILIRKDNINKLYNILINIIK